MTTTEPWQAFYSDASDLDLLLPGPLAQLRRAEAVERAEEARKEQERQERADNRQQLAMWSARQHALARGLPWDPTKPFEHMPTIYQRADAAFALQDREQRDADRRALQEAGLHHLVADLPSPGPGASGAPSSSPPAAAHGPGPGGSGAATRGVPSMGDDPRADKSPAGKARLALRRWRAGERRQRFEVNP